MPKLPLSKVLATVRELIDRGYDPTEYLAYFRLDDQGGLLRHE